MTVPHLKVVLLCCLVVSLSLASCTPEAQSGCDGVDRTLSDSDKSALAPNAAKHLEVARVAITRSFRAEGWRILLAESSEAEPAFLFYSADPASSIPVTTWGGAAPPSEEKAIRDWAVTNAPGIPSSLARCFAFYVTHERD